MNFFPRWLVPCTTLPPTLVALLPNWRRRNKWRSPSASASSTSCQQGCLMAQERQRSQLSCPLLSHSSFLFTNNMKILNVKIRNISLACFIQYLTHLHIVYLNLTLCMWHFDNILKIEHICIWKCNMFIFDHIPKGVIDPDNGLY